MRLVQALLIPLAVFFSEARNASAEVDEKPADFHLCRSNVEDVALVAESGGVAVYVKLTGSTSRELFAFTEATLGKRARVMAGHRVLFDVSVRVAVDAGQLASRALSRADAENLAQEIGEALPSAPCGVAGGPGD